MVVLLTGIGVLLGALIDKLNKNAHRAYVLPGRKEDHFTYSCVFEKCNFTYDSGRNKNILDSIKPDVTVFTGAFDANYHFMKKRAYAPNMIIAAILSGFLAAAKINVFFGILIGLGIVALDWLFTKLPKRVIHHTGDALKGVKRRNVKVGVLLLSMSLGISLFGCTGSNEPPKFSQAVTAPAMNSEPAMSESDENISQGEEPNVGIPSQEDHPNISMPYHELGFGADDFRFAGYSVTDGDHTDEILKAVSETLPSAENYSTDKDWVYCPEITTPKSINAFFYRKIGSAADTSAGIYYIASNMEQAQHTPHSEIILKFSYDIDHIGEKIVDHYPLLESPVIPEMDQDEVLERLKLTEIVNAAKLDNNNGDYCFESQHGESHCILNEVYDSNSPTTQLYIIKYSNVRITLSFVNNLLLYIDCRAMYT